jgi:glucose dehydrogenase
MLPPGSKESDWTIPGHDYGSTRLSELDKITTTNVAQLKEAWSYTTGIADGHEGQPLVVGGRMYVVTPYPNKLVAFDLSKPGPAKLWEYAPGNVLWKTHFNSGIIGNPITYLGPDGKQCVAVYEGVGGWAGAIVPGNLSTDDPFAALGAVNAMKDLPEHTKAGGALHVFELP